MPDMFKIHAMKTYLAVSLNLKVSMFAVNVDV